MSIEQTVEDQTVAEVTAPSIGVGLCQASTPCSSRCVQMLEDQESPHHRYSFSQFPVECMSYSHRRSIERVDLPIQTAWHFVSLLEHRSSKRPNVLHVHQGCLMLPEKSHQCMQTRSAPSMNHRSFVYTTTIYF